MENQALKQVINDLKKNNPYPVDVFPEPLDKDWKNIGEFLHKHGKNGERIFARWGRMVWENCIATMEEYIAHHTEEEEKP